MESVITEIPYDYPVNLRAAVDDFIRRHKGSSILDCGVTESESVVYTVYLEWGSTLQTFSWTIFPSNESMSSYKPWHNSMKVDDIKRFMRLSQWFTPENLGGQL